MHRIGRNQSLAEIARLYRVTPQRLSDLNHLPGGRLRGIRELVVPAVAGPGVVAVVTPAVAPAAGAAREVVVRREIRSRRSPPVIASPRRPWRG